MTRFFTLCLLVCVLCAAAPAVAPLSAQAAPVDSLIAHIPVSFDGYLRVHVADTVSGINGMRLLTVVASFLQPTRISPPNQPTYNTFFPLTSFNNASFDDDVLPWLQGDIVAAYRHLDIPLSASRGELLLILPTRDSFLSAGIVGTLMGESDPTSRLLGDAVIYDGQNASVALLPDVILIGSADVIDEAVTGAVDGSRLTDDATYQAVMGGAQMAAPLLTAYVHGDTARAALPFLLSQRGDVAQPFLQLFGQALQAGDFADALLPALLEGRVDAIGVTADLSLNDAGQLSQSTAAARVHFVDPVPVSSRPTAADTYFDWVPQNALVVISGESARDLAQQAITALPLYNLSGVALNGFPVAISAGAQADVITPPTVDQLAAAVDGFMTSVQAAAGVDLRADVLDRLNGGVVLALLPRPNNPTPLLDTPYDALIVTPVNSPAAVVNALVNTIKAFLGDAAVIESSVRGESFWTVSDAIGAKVLQIGSVDGLLIIGTGDAVDAALRAHAGEDRLIDRTLWAAASTEGTQPSLYIDANAFYTTFLPQVLSGGSGGVPVDFVRASASFVDGNTSVYELRVRVQIRQ